MDSSSTVQLTLVLMGGAQSVALTLLLLIVNDLRSRIIRLEAEYFHDSKRKG